jgi:hypothetical protein
MRLFMAQPSYGCNTRNCSFYGMPYPQMPTQPSFCCMNPCNSCYNSCPFPFSCTNPYCSYPSFCPDQTSCPFMMDNLPYNGPNPCYNQDLANTLYCVLSDFFSKDQDQDPGYQIDDETGLGITPDGYVVNPWTGALVDSDTGLDIDSTGTLLQDPNTGRYVSPNTGEQFDMDAQTGLGVTPDGYVVNPQTGALVDSDTGLDIDSTGTLLQDPNTGRYVHPNTGEVFDIDDQTGLGVTPDGFYLNLNTGRLMDAGTGYDIDFDTGDLIDPETGERFPIAGGDDTEGFSYNNTLLPNNENAFLPPLKSPNMPF